MAVYSLIAEADRPWNAVSDILSMKWGQWMLLQISQRFADGCAFPDEVVVSPCPWGKAEDVPMESAGLLPTYILEMFPFTAEASGRLARRPGSLAQYYAVALGH